MFVPHDQRVLEYMDECHWILLLASNVQASIPVLLGSVLLT